MDAPAVEVAALTAGAPAAARPHSAPVVMVLDVDDDGRAAADSTTPPPAAADDEEVSEVLYSRWLVEERNRQAGDEQRLKRQQFRSFRRRQESRFQQAQLRRIEETQQQLAAASAERARAVSRNHEIVTGMRRNLLELKESVVLEKRVHERKGRLLANEARQVQTAKLLERQLSARGKKQAMGAQARAEQIEVEARRIALRQQESELKRQAAARVRDALDTSTSGAPGGTSSTRGLEARQEVLARDNAAAADFIRELEQQSVEKRLAARHAFLSVQAAKRRAADESKRAARSARSGLVEQRRAQADAVRQAKLAESARRAEAGAEEERRTRGLRDAARRLLAPQRLVLAPSTTSTSSTAGAAHGHAAQRRLLRGTGTGPGPGAGTGAGSGSGSPMGRTPASRQDVDRARAAVERHVMPAPASRREFNLYDA